MRAELTIEGDLGAQLLELARGHRNVVNKAIADQTAETTNQLRAHVASRLSGRAAFTVASRIEPTPGEPEVLQGLISSRWTRKVGGKRINILDAFARGGVITPQRSRFLAIPLPAAGKTPRGGRMTPEIWEQLNDQELTYVERRGRPPLLVAKAGRIGARGAAVSATQSRVGVSRIGRGGGRGSVAAWLSVPIFVLVRRARLPRRLEVGQIKAEGDARLPEKIVIALEALRVGSRL